jgi:hypothetical protein
MEDLTTIFQKSVYSDSIYYISRDTDICEFVPFLQCTLSFQWT